MRELASFNLPYPISVNKLYRVAGKSIYKIPEAKKYYLSVRAMIGWKIDTIPINKEIGIKINLNPPDSRRRDIDNCAKLILDSLQAARVYENDCQIKQLVMTMYDKSLNPGAQITIYEYNKKF